jgi:DNA segregation ATPase FtsK/SpoIIIE-like protein
MTTTQDTSQPARDKPDKTKPAPNQGIDLNKYVDPILQDVQQTTVAALGLYRRHLDAWKVLAAVALAGAFVASTHPNPGVLLLAVPGAAATAYGIHKMRLEAKPVQNGRIEAGQTTGRRAKRIREAATRTAVVTGLCTAWLFAASLADLNTRTAVFIWACGAAAWGIASYQLCWRDAERDRVPVAFDLAEDPDEATPPATGAAPPDTDRDEHPAPSVPAPAPPVAPVDPPSPFSLPPTPPPKPRPAAKDTIRNTATHTARTAATIQQTFEQFKVAAAVDGHVRGPSVTVHHVVLADGTKVAKVTALAPEISYALGNVPVRIEPVRGRQLLGVEVPNIARDLVTYEDALRLAQAAGLRIKHPLQLPILVDAAGEAMLLDITLLPHLLIASATNGGKSVCLHALITGVLRQATPEQVRLILVDPKRVELSVYDGVPHLLRSVANDPGDAEEALEWLVAETERRYELLEHAKVRNIDGYNAKVRSGQLADSDGNSPPPLPRILAVIDEFADLLIVAGAGARRGEEDGGSTLETSIQRITQIARAAGVHLVLATQRPSTDVVTGIIKANIPSQLAFVTANATDSRVILGVNGAEKLTGAGDGLLRLMTDTKPRRVQSVWISEEDVAVTAEHWRSQRDRAGHQDTPAVRRPLEQPGTATPERSTRGRRTARDVIIAAVTEHGGAIDKETLVEATSELKEKARNAALTDLSRDGVLVRTGHGRYDLAERARQTNEPVDDDQESRGDETP